MTNTTMTTAKKNNKRLVFEIMPQMVNTNILVGKYVLLWPARGDGSAHTTVYVQIT